MFLKNTLFCIFSIKYKLSTKSYSSCSRTAFIRNVFCDVFLLERSNGKIFPRKTYFYLTLSKLTAIFCPRLSDKTHFCAQVDPDSLEFTFSANCGIGKVSFVLRITVTELEEGTLIYFKKCYFAFQCQVKTCF